MCVSKVQHMTGWKTGCNQSRPVFFGFLIFWQTSQLATENFQNLCNCNQWSSLLQLGSVRFRSFFQSSELDMRTLSVLHRRLILLWNQLPRRFHGQWSGWDWRWGWGQWRWSCCCWGKERSQGKQVRKIEYLDFIAEADLFIAKVLQRREREICM